MSEDADEELEKKLLRLETRLIARIFRKTAEAIRKASRTGYWSPGGPQDGPGEPDSFDSFRAADELDAEADEADPP